jgi:two-component system CheB/CheR fusion protein
VALIDLAMPGADGFEVARRLRESLDSLPILIAVTGRDSKWDREQAARVGVAIHLTKQVPPAELVVLLEQCEQARRG